MVLPVNCMWCGVSNVLKMRWNVKSLHALKDKLTENKSLMFLIVLTSDTVSLMILCKSAFI